MNGMYNSWCALVAVLLILVSASSAASDNDDVETLDWWQTTVFYQIYPRSFKDSDANGVGDLKGIAQNLEHFVDAGVGAIWLSPIFKSPMVDFGYDISDFRKIDESYGTIEDFEELIERAHELGLKVVLDFVPNHASNQSDYFKLSENRTQGYEDFFIWDDGLLDPEDNQTRLPPSNWVSQFQGSAWQWNEKRDQYFLHQFSIGQVDLNYRNPIVVNEMKSILTFWLDKGVDGFRIDAVPYLVEASKEQYGGRYPDDPLSGAAGIGPDQLGYTVPIYSKDLDESYDIVYDWRSLLDQYAQKDGQTRVMLTEAYANLSRTMKFYGTGSENGSNIPFNFDFITNVNGNSSARDMVYTALRWLTYMPEGRTANWVFGNHDNSRMASRFGPHLVDGLNMLDLLLPGVAITYQGDEIGMENGYVSYRDTVDVSGCSAGEEDYQKYSRDPARTPFQWDNTTNAGFSNASKTWLPVAQNYRTLNLKNQLQSQRSHFKVYQALTAARRQKTIQYGDWNLRPLSDNVLVLLRTLNGSETYVLIFNFGYESEEVDLSRYHQLPDELQVYIVSTDSTKNPGDAVRKNSIFLDNGEALVLVAQNQS